MKMIENDLTQGSVLRKLWVFTLPMASLMQVIVGFAFFFSGRWKKKLL